MTVFVVNKQGQPLMPTTRVGKVRHLLKSGKAVIYKRDPFTIQLQYDTTNYTQPLELCVDTGYLYVGCSVKSEKKEYLSEQRDLLSDEKQQHDDRSKYRRSRRNRKRYRAPRFDNRKATKKKGWIAPSLKNKADRHIDIVKNICAVSPAQEVYLEMGQFDTQVLQAIEEGKPIPEGLDYQHGPRYGFDTLREAVFQRDGYKCIFCGRGIDKGAILHTHHAYYWDDRHADRLDELATCCEKCHTPKNHEKGGKLWGYNKEMKSFSGAAFMNTVKWYIYHQLKEILPDKNIHITYGSVTKRTRLDLGLEKSHVNDAYAMGKYHPEERADFSHYKKRRRNNRVLEKFYDAKYIDIRDGKKRKGKELGCERIKRRESRRSDKNLRIFHGKKTSKGHRSIRRRRYTIQPGTILLYENQYVVSKGTQHYGEYVTLVGHAKAPSVKDVKIVKHPNGWTRVR